MVVAKPVKKPYKFDAKKKAQFCEFIARGVGVVKASAGCGIDRHTYQDHYATDEAFREAVDSAVEEANDLIENALFEAARNGDVKAQSIWLYNRRKEKWADSRNIKIDAEIQTKGPIKLKWADELNATEETTNESE